MIRALVIGALAVLAVWLNGVIGFGADKAEPADAPPPAAATEFVPRAKLVKVVGQRERLEVRAHRLRVQLRRERHLGYLVRNPSPEHNRELARILFPPAEFAALDMIAAGGDGIGGEPGESDWRETVWNGGGTDPAHPGPTARSCGGGAIAYGIGQACPRDKMIAWAGTKAVIRIASLQLWWMKAYGTVRKGSLVAAGAAWSSEGSW